MGMGTNTGKHRSRFNSKCSEMDIIMINRLNNNQIRSRNSSIRK